MPTQQIAGEDIVIDASGVGFAFGTGAARKPVLHHIDLRVAQGEFVILTGPSGAGKTTLLSLIGALRSLQAGSITVLGTELNGLTIPGQTRIRRQIGYIFQDHNLFDALTAFQCLRLATELREQTPTKEQALAEAQEMLEQLGLGAYLHARPGELSTGQKQRVAIARALINTPPIILADEPTASLDLESSRLVMARLRAHVAVGASIVMITHDSRIFPQADRLIRMADGYIEG
jgi:putative ABC transport system ATP-binding protein